jgi:hypothetical protein
MVIKIANKNLSVKNISGPVGVRGRNSDNKLYKDKIGWEPSQSLENGIVKTYNFIGQQVMNKNNLTSADLDMRDKFLV